MSKFVNDVRASSADRRYAGVVFRGPMENAIKQAKAAPDHGPRATLHLHFGVSRNRYALLKFLRVLP